MIDYETKVKHNKAETLFIVGCGKLGTEVGHCIAEIACRIGLPKKIVLFDPDRVNGTAKTKLLASDLVKETPGIGKILKCESRFEDKAESVLDNCKPKNMPLIVMCVDRKEPVLWTLKLWNKNKRKYRRSRMLVLNAAYDPSTNDCVYSFMDLCPCRSHEEMVRTFNHLWDIGEKELEGMTCTPSAAKVAAAVFYDLIEEAIVGELPHMPSLCGRLDVPCFRSKRRKS